MTINVLFLAAEAEPFIKIGGLGDVAGALPETIHKISLKNQNVEKVDIRLVIPYHFAIKQKKLDLDLLGEFGVKSRQGVVICKVYYTENSGIPVYLLDGEPIDEKSPVYSMEPIHDGNKFVFFSLAALGLADFLNWRVDILQANDWHTATAIYALKNRSKEFPTLEKTKSILTLHNLPYMGFGIQQALTDYYLPPSKTKSLPEWALHSPLPLGLRYAERIIAVSPHYAEEILTPEFGCGLVDFLKTRRKVLDGILNGLDTEKWDPSTDPFIAQRFTKNDLPLRLENKHFLQKQFKLMQNDDIPLLTMVSRMDHQKGIDIALRGLNYLEDLPWQAIILGTGTPYIEEMAKVLEKRYPDRVRSVIGFDNTLAHQLYAGADIFMMPSRYEPCGLSQMISMRYGCIPVARATGGLVDTINHVSHKVDGSTGYLFEKPYPSVFAKTLRRALTHFHRPDSWKQLQLNGMNLDFSWEKSAQEYINVYKDLKDKNN